MEQVEVARTIDVDPAAQTELVFLLAFLRPEVIEEGLDVLGHVIMELGHNRLLEFEQIGGVMPAAGVGSLRPVARVQPQALSEFLQSLIQMLRSILAMIAPGW